jgi:hypothetical protein
MGLFGKLEKKTPEKTEECVLVYFEADPLPEEFWRLDERLNEAMDKSDVGEFDGNEIGGGTARLFFYGPDASKLFLLIEPILQEYPMCHNARVILRRGGPGSPQTEFQLKANNDTSLHLN